MRRTSAADALDRAQASGVGVAAYPEIATAAPDSPGVVLGYGMIDVGRIDEGLARLQQCLGAD